MKKTTKKTTERSTQGNGGSKKSRQREQLILMLLQQPSLERAASAIGISGVTAWRISKTLEFQQEYRQARRDSMEQSARRLQQGCAAAASTLIKIMMDSNSPAASRLRAADSIFSHSKSLMELEDLDVRLRRVEEIAASQEENRQELDRRAA